MNYAQSHVISVVYSNYRGEVAVRKIVPKKIWFGKTEWHPEDQWMLDVFDVEKNADRSYAMKDIRTWFTEK